MQNQLTQPLIGEPARDVSCYSECDSFHEENLIYFNKSATQIPKAKGKICEVHNSTVEEATENDNAKIIIDVLDHDYKMDIQEFKILGDPQKQMTTEQKDSYKKHMLELE